MRGREGRAHDGVLELGGPQLPGGLQLRQKPRVKVEQLWQLAKELVELGCDDHFRAEQRLSVAVAELNKCVNIGLFSSEYFGHQVGALRARFGLVEGGDARVACCYEALRGGGVPPWQRCEDGLLDGSLQHVAQDGHTSTGPPIARTVAKHRRWRVGPLHQLAIHHLITEVRGGVGGLKIRIGVPHVLLAEDGAVGAPRPCLPRLCFTELA
jgi:hypothetical protein